MCLKESTHVFDFGVRSNILGVVGKIFEDDLRKSPKLFNVRGTNQLTHRFVVDGWQNDGFLDGSDHNLP